MSANEIKNVLVLGDCGFNISKFGQLFSAYLQYNSYEEAIELQPNLTQTVENDEHECRSHLVGNLNLICALDLKNALIARQVLSIVEKFTNKLSLNAIIILLKFDQNNIVYLNKLKNGLFNKLQEFYGNILYLYELDSSHYNYQNRLIKEVKIFETKNRNVEDKNIFYFQEHTFSAISKSNWKKGFYFCKTINNCINSLQKSYIRSITPVKSVLNFIDNLLELFIQIYITCAFSGSHKISAYKRNTTVCYNNKCVQMLQGIPHARICHAPCNCIFSNSSNCNIFETSNNACIQCKCNTDFHSEIYFKYCKIPYCRIDETLLVEICVLFFIYKENKEAAHNFKNIILKRNHLKSTHVKFYLKFAEKVRIFKKDVITFSHIIIWLLYALKKIRDMPEATIVPEFLEEIFPEDFKLEIVPEIKEIAEQSNTSEEDKPGTSSSCEMQKTNENQIRVLNKEIAELNRKMDQLLSLNKSIWLRENPKINEDLQASTSNIEVNKTKKKT